MSVLDAVLPRRRRAIKPAVEGPAAAPELKPEATAPALEVLIRLAPKEPRVLDCPSDVMVDVTWQVAGGGLRRRVITGTPNGPVSRPVKPADPRPRDQHTGPLVICHARAGVLRVIWASPGVRVRVRDTRNETLLSAGGHVPLPRR